MINQSGLTAKEVVEKCNELGNGIDTTRLSKLQNGKLSAPSEKVSRDIAKVCNEDDRLLVLEGYLEKAPKEIVQAFISIKYMTTIAALHNFENTFDQRILVQLKEQMEKQPLSEFIVSLIDNGSADITINKEKIEFNIEKENLNFVLHNPSFLKVTDNAMYPTIPKNAEITLRIQEQYNDGDILAIKVKGDENFIVRYAFFKDSSIILTSLNPKDFQKLEYKTKEITILGKVIKVTTDIQI
jgi:hypothetical protein